ncbi:MAG: hypothetical protein U0350_49345 [Caldilineaceae bacterium]
MKEKTSSTKRYNLVLPEDLFDQVQQLADDRQTTIVDMLRRFIKLGVLAAQIENSPNSALVIRQGNIEQQIILI